MKKTASVYLTAMLLLCFSGAIPAGATPLTSPLDAPLSEVWVTNLESQATGMPSALWTIGADPFKATGNPFTVDFHHAGYIIKSAQSMHSEGCEASRFSGLTMSLPDGTGAPDSTWGTSGYPGETGTNHSRNNVLDSCQRPGNASQAGHFVGIAFTTKDYEYLMAASNNYNWMFTVLTLYGCDVAGSAFRKTC